MMITNLLLWHAAIHAVSDTGFLLVLLTLIFLIFIFSPTYNVSITQINVGGNAGDLDFYAIFDSGTSFTYLNDPAYTLISESVSSLNHIFHAVSWSPFFPMQVFIIMLFGSSTI